MFERILVPLDGSALAERTIPHAEMFARIFGSKIILLRVMDFSSPKENAALIDPLIWRIRKAEAEVYLSEVAGRIRAQLASSENASGIELNEENRVECVIREGRTAENIINYAHSEDIQLVVISTHGQGGLSRWNISSITQKVVDKIYLPVLIVRAFKPAEAEDARVLYRRILLPTDSSRRAECALPPGIALEKGELPARTNLGADAATAHEPQFPRSELIFASIIRTPEIPIPEPYPDELDQIYKKYIEVNRRIVSRYLNTIEERLCIGSEKYIIESKDVSSAIHELVEQKNIDLVILSAHGISGQFNHPYGSIARNYIEQGTQTVLIIQDIPRSQFKPTAAQAASENRGESLVTPQDKIRDSGDDVNKDTAPNPGGKTDQIREPVNAFSRRNYKPDRRAPGEFWMDKPVQDEL